MPDSLRISSSPRGCWYFVVHKLHGQQVLWDSNAYLPAGGVNPPELCRLWTKLNAKGGNWLSLYSEAMEGTHNGHSSMLPRVQSSFKQDGFWKSCFSVSSQTSPTLQKEHTFSLMLLLLHISINQSPSRLTELSFRFLQSPVRRAHDVESTTGEGSKRQKYC